MFGSSLQRLQVHLAQASSIARRYFVTNGFDSALTMLGLLVGFYTAGSVSVEVAIKVCMGVAIALGVSGLSSTWLSETAERKRDLQKLESALLDSLEESDHARASNIVPILVAVVSGLSPFLISLIIMLPLWLAEIGLITFSPYVAAVIVAMIVLFLLGIMLGRLSRENWLWAGLRTVLIAVATAGIILLFN